MMTLEFYDKIIFDMSACISSKYLTFCVINSNKRWIFYSTFQLEKATKRDISSDNLYLAMAQD